MSDLNAFDALFDKELTELAELPSYVPPPTGTYNLRISVGFKEINKKPAVEVRATVLDTIELADETEQRVKPGSEFNYAFILLDKDGKPNETAEGFMREFLAYFTDYAQTTNLKELVSGAIKDVDCTAFVKRKQDNKDADRWNVNVKDIVIA
jgi:hypothetical protein